MYKKHNEWLHVCNNVLLLFSISKWNITVSKFSSHYTLDPYCNAYACKRMKYVICLYLNILCLKNNMNYELLVACLYNTTTWKTIHISALEVSVSRHSSSWCEVVVWEKKHHKMNGSFMHRLLAIQFSSALFGLEFW
jgi:hypothetical protein